MSYPSQCGLSTPLLKDINSSNDSQQQLHHATECCCGMNGGHALLNACEIVSQDQPTTLERVTDHTITGVWALNCVLFGMLLHKLYCNAYE